MTRSLRLSSPEPQAAPPPEAQLLAAALRPTPGQRVLLRQCDAELAVALAAAGARVTFADTQLAALVAARDHARARGVQITLLDTLSPLPDSAASYDLVAIHAPPVRAQTRRMLVEAADLLLPGGHLYLVGANDAGIRPAIDDAQALFGGISAPTLRARRRLVTARRPADLPPAPDWARAPGIAPGSWLAYTVDLADGPLAVRALPGVFAADRLDAGTRLLLQHLAVQPGVRALDVGCGTGIIGAAIARRGAAHVTLVDSDLWAVAAAQETLAANTITNATVRAHDARARIGERYNLVVINPPFHRGVITDYALGRAIVAQASAALVPGGRLLLVANEFVRYDAQLTEQLAEVQVLAQDAGYRVLSGRARA